MIKKKDNKLIEIDKILTEEVSPQLDILRKEKDDYALFKSNEGHLEEFEKILIAYEFFDSDKFLITSDSKATEYAENIKRLNNELITKAKELDNIKLQMNKMKEDTSNDKDFSIKEELHKLQKEIDELTYQRDILSRDKQ